MWALLLLACSGGDGKGSSDSSGQGTDTGETGDSGAEAQAAWATASGDASDALGSRVSLAGDLNGDGLEDLLVSAWLGNRACALFGPLAEGDLAFDARDPACLSGESSLDYAGYALGSAGDLDGDGYPELLVGSPGHADTGANAGKAYYVPGPIAAGTTGLGEAAQASWSGSNLLDYVGISIVSVGDLTGDGVADLAIGAPGFDGEGGGGGRAWVVEGPIGAGEQDLDATWASVTGLSAPSTLPYPLHGALGTGDFVGDAIAGAADYDGDGLDDLALGANGDQTHGPETGKIAVFFGPVDAGASLVSDAGLTLIGATSLAYTGSPVLASPDLDGDGLPELLVSADGVDAGVVYVLHPSPGADGSVDEASVRLAGVGTGDQLGASLATPRDLDGDGALDLAVGAPLADGVEADAGAAYVFYGPLDSGVNAASEATALLGEHDYDTFGCAIELMGDLSGDGYDEIVVGARDNDAGGSYSGRIYLYSP